MLRLSCFSEWCAFSLFEQDGAKLLCDKVSLQFLKGSTVEFAESLMKSAFQVRLVHVNGVAEPVGF